MTNSRIPEAKLREVRKLAVEYYMALQELEIEYLDPWISADTYTTDGVLDADAYKAALTELRSFGQSRNARYRFPVPTKDGGRVIMNEPLFGHYTARAFALLKELNKETSDG